jgi:hypothetical protein
VTETEIIDAAVVAATSPDDLKRRVAVSSLLVELAHARCEIGRLRGEVARWTDRAYRLEADPFAGEKDRT